MVKWADVVYELPLQIVLQTSLYYCCLMQACRNREGGVESGPVGPLDLFLAGQKAPRGSGGMDFLVSLNSLM